MIERVAQVALFFVCAFFYQHRFPPLSGTWRDVNELGDRGCQRNYILLSLGLVHPFWSPALRTEWCCAAPLGRELEKQFLRENDSTNLLR